MLKNGVHSITSGIDCMPVKRFSFASVDHMAYVLLDSNFDIMQFSSVYLLKFIVT